MPALRHLLPALALLSLLLAPAGAGAAAKKKAKPAACPKGLVAGPKITPAPKRGKAALACVRVTQPPAPGLAGVVSGALGLEAQPPNARARRALAAVAKLERRQKATATTLHQSLTTAMSRAAEGPRLTSVSKNGGSAEMDAGNGVTAEMSYNDSGAPTGSVGMNFDMSQTLRNTTHSNGIGGGMKLFATRCPDASGTVPGEAGWTVRSRRTGVKDGVRHELDILMEGEGRFTAHVGPDARAATYDVVGDGVVEIRMREVDVKSGKVKHHPTRTYRAHHVANGLPVKQLPRDEAGSRAWFEAQIANLTVRGPKGKRGTAEDAKQAGNAAAMALVPAIFAPLALKDGDVRWHDKMECAKVEVAADVPHTSTGATVTYTSKVTAADGTPAEGAWTASSDCPGTLDRREGTGRDLAVRQTDGGGQWAPGTPSCVAVEVVSRAGRARGEHSVAVQQLALRFRTRFDREAWSTEGNDARFEVVAEVPLDATGKGSAPVTFREAYFNHKANLGFLCNDGWYYEAVEATKPGRIDVLEVVPAPGGGIAKVAFDIDPGHESYKMWNVDAGDCQREPEVEWQDRWNVDFATLHTDVLGDSDKENVYRFDLKDLKPGAGGELGTWTFHYDKGTTWGTVTTTVQVVTA